MATDQTERVPTDQVERVNRALAGRYRVERELGRGGMATVYLAEDLKHSREVALKVLRPELTTALGPSRFLREIEIASKLSHPHILPLYDSGRVPIDAARRGADNGPEELLFYVMPFVRGETLRQKLQREKQLAIDEALSLARQVALALDHAHSQNLIHRDIKPENILLHEGEAMVADFGIALTQILAPGERLTEGGIVLGTAEYMSPEQITGELTIDARSDIYSLGCLVFELLAGEPPYTGPTFQSVISRRFTEPIPSIWRLRADVPGSVELALRTALAISPSDRFPSAATFAAALVARSSASHAWPLTETTASRVAAALPRRRSVAVLPFQNLSADPENEFFTDGVTEDVIAQLSRIRSLKVISSSSVMPFKKRDRSLREIGATLGVATILEGSVRRAGDRVRIVAQLIDAESDQHLWADTYDRQLTDIFSIQSDVALHIATALQAELSVDERTRINREPTSDLEAYQLYLQGRHWLVTYTESGILRAISYFEQATTVDPRFAMAYVGIAQACAEIGMGQGGGSMEPPEAYRRAKEATARALRIDTGLGEARCMQALLKYIVDFDWTGAEQEFRVALALSPGNADAHDYLGRLYSALGRSDDALAMVRRAKELDPLAHRSDVASELLRARRNEEAAEAAQRVIEFDTTFPRGHSALGWAWLRMGRLEEGVREIEQAVAISPGDTLFLGQLGQAYGLAGREADARNILRQLQEMTPRRYVSPYHVAYVHVGLGEYEKALDLLEEAYETRSGAIYGVRGSFLFEPLRSHPRFKAILRKMNLPESLIESG
jgi:eukaryotic-like serine/threonine-protein kinase